MPLDDEREALMNGLAAFIEQVVVLTNPPQSSADALGVKLDVLERLIELLRLIHGSVGNKQRIEDLLSHGLEVSRSSMGGLRVRVGVNATQLRLPGWPAPGGRSQAELQVPLMLYMFVTYRKKRAISDLLVDFLEELRPWLSPSDVESTRTGVMRVMTTTRSAARALRLHGLISDSQRTAYKSWELTVLGLVVAALLIEREGTSLEMQPRGLRVTSGGRFGASNHLTEPLSKIARELHDPRNVTRALHRVCSPNREVFPTFDRVVGIIVSWSKRREESLTSRHPDMFQLRKQARELVSELSTLVPENALADDMAKDFALRDVLGEPIW
jgi:hypothetical protein